MPYQPPAEVIERYAQVLVNFALHGGRGIRPGEVVYIDAPEITRPLYLAVCRAVWRSGGHVIHGYRPDDTRDEGPVRDLLALGSERQIKHFPKLYTRGLVDEMDHLIGLIGSADIDPLTGIDKRKAVTRLVARGSWAEWRREKEAAGKLTWTMALYGTAAMAAEVGLSEEAYWEQIINACLLDSEDPVAAWREVQATMRRHLRWLNRLRIERVHVQGPDADLRVRIGEQRKWLGGGGRNIPSFECFTSPDWRGTEGWMRFNQPLYFQGTRVEGAELRFAKGRVVKASAAQGEEVLQGIVAAKGGERVGEFSLTDSRLSRITKFMGTTLYDENQGGRHGNTHIALGQAYIDAFDGDSQELTSADWRRLGYNRSPLHVDIISTAPRTVTATLASGRERVIYADGRFQLD